MMVEVFKTNVALQYQSEVLVLELLAHLPGSKINFDLDDCDRILRIEANHVPQTRIVEIMTANGYLCTPLE